MKCIFECNESETRRHVVIHCFPVNFQNAASNVILNFDDILGSIYQQKQVINFFVITDKKRKEMKDNFSPEGDAAPKG